MFVLLVVVAAIGGVAWARALSRRPVVEVDAEAMPALAAAHRRVRLAFVAGLLAGAVAGIAVWVEDPTGLGRGPALAPLVTVLVAVIAVCAAELTAPRASGPVRSASVAGRSARDVVDGPSLRSALAGASVLVGLLVLGWAMGSADDLGRAGRALTTRCGDLGSSRGPWPGSFYALPALVGVGVLALVVAATVGAVVRRPAPGQAGESGDSALRRASARRVLLVAGAGAAALAAPVGALMGSALLGVSCRPPGYAALGVVCLALAALGGALGAASAGAALAGPRLVERRRS